MPLTYTASARILDTNPPVPDGTPSAYTAWTSMQDARKYLRDSSWGHLAWDGGMSVSGTALLPQIQVSAISAVCLYDATTAGWYTFENALHNVGVTEIDGAPGTLALDTWYYVYVYVAIGGATLGYQISTTPPNTPGVVGYRDRFKTGETKNYLFLGSFRTDGAGDPRPMVKRAGVCTYGIGHGAAGATTIAPNITSAVYVATTTLPNFIPPHAAAVDVIVSGTPNGAAIGSVRVQPAFGFGAGEYYLGVGVAGTPDTTASWRIPLLLQGEVVAARQNLQAICVSGGVIPTCTITVAGWPE